MADNLTRRASSLENRSERQGRQDQTGPSWASLAVRLPLAFSLPKRHRKSGQLDKALEFFEAAVKQDPEFEEAHVGLGRALISLGKPDLALPQLRKAASLNPANEVSYYQLAQVCRGWPTFRTNRKRWQSSGACEAKSQVGRNP